MPTACHPRSRAPSPTSSALLIILIALIPAGIAAAKEASPATAAGASAALEGRLEEPPHARDAPGDPALEPDPAQVQASPGAAAQAPPSTRERDRILLMAGTGIPDLTHLQLDVAFLPKLAISGRLSTAVFLYSAASIGLTGFVPLSGDGYVVPRHAISISAEASSYYVIAFPFPFTESGSTLIYSLGYAFTGEKGFHVRASLGTWGPLRIAETWEKTELPLGARISIGALF